MTTTSPFAPSLQQVAAAGTPVTRQPYPEGYEGVRLALKECAKRIREGGRSTAVQEVAYDILAKAGFTGRGTPTDAGASGSSRDRAAALLTWVRQNTLYAQDPPNTEHIKSAEAMLCIRPQLCVKIGDCDDQIVLLGSLLMSVGIPCKILKQTFGDSAQEHVLIEAIDEDGRSFPLDPSYDYPAGQKATGATKEVTIDPLSDKDIEGVSGAPPEAELITVGRVPRTLGIVTPGDVLAYRRMWDSYVVNTTRACLACSQLWATAAATNGNVGINTGQFEVPPDQKTKALWASGLSTDSDSIMAEWNIYANMPDYMVVLEAANILRAYQQTVLNVGQTYQPNVRQNCPNVPLPLPPSLDLQQQVISRIEGLGILQHGILQLIGIGNDGFLQTEGAIVNGGAAAVTTAGSLLTNPWFWMGIGAAGAIGLGVYMHLAASKR